ncbi:hypothetical protein F5884DRAFT_324871 [Xylogone sp. PMI_703]|nr:hypothetical protein F5884DRAFT_324871 [Xylogone sp. PMI_703]
MEPFPKRQRLVNLLETELQHNSTVTGDYSEASSSGEDEADDYDLVEYNSGEELEKKRAELNNKLKSAFENIFEKYGREFDGIGDEIDLYTGEVVVDNGHLLRMEGETDAGDSFRGRQMLRALTVEPDQVVIDSVEDDEFNQEESSMADGDYAMEEDDMILRGFRPPIDYAASFNWPERKYKKGSPLKRPIQNKKASEGLIEPAWHAPMNTSGISTLRREKKKMTWQEVNHPPSPPSGPSLWAPEPPPRRRRRNIQNSHTTLEEESQQIEYHEDIEVRHTFLVSSSLSRRRKTRTPFTVEDDKILLKWIRKLRKEGRGLAEPAWTELELKHPQHTWVSWRNRFRDRYHGHLPDEQDSDNDSVEITTVTQKSPKRHRKASRGAKVAKSVPIDTTHPQPISKPARPKRRAKKSVDDTYVDWSEAMASLEQVDPELHAELLKDTRREQRFFQHNLSDSSDSSDPVFDDTSHDHSRRSTKRSLHSANFRAASPDLADGEESDLGVLQSLELEDHNNSTTLPVACPHTDCRSFSTIKYRVIRLHNEQQPEIYMHLLRQHSTTPFPCFEEGCKHIGNDGYFNLADLVTHVKVDHPGGHALRRLQDRISSELIEHKDGQLEKSALDEKAIAGNSSMRKKASKVVSVDEKSNTVPGREENSGHTGLESPDRNRVKSLEAHPSGRYPCPLRDSVDCDLTFAWPPEAYRHAKTHGKGKPLLCSYSGCRKSFYHQSHLQDHVKIHDSLQRTERAIDRGDTSSFVTGHPVLDNTSDLQFPLGEEATGLDESANSPTEGVWSNYWPQNLNASNAVNDSSRRELPPENQTLPRSQMSSQHTNNESPGDLSTLLTTPILNKCIRTEIPDSVDRSQESSDEDAFQGIITNEGPLSEEEAVPSQRDKTSPRNHPLPPANIPMLPLHQAGLGYSVDKSYMFSDEEDNYQGITLQESSKSEPPSNQMIPTLPEIASVPSEDCQRAKEDKSMNNPEDQGGNISQEIVLCEKLEAPSLKQNILIVGKDASLSTSTRQLSATGTCDTSKPVNELPGSNHNSIISDSEKTMTPISNDPAVKNASIREPFITNKPRPDDIESQSISMLQRESPSSKPTGKLSTPSTAKTVSSDKKESSKESIHKQHNLPEAPSTETKPLKRRRIEMEDSEDELGFHPNDKALMGSRRTSKIAPKRHSDVR